MTKLIAFFFVALLGITLRWLIIGEYNPTQLQLAFILLAAAPFILLISLVQKKKDEVYKPLHPNNEWSTSLKDKWLTGSKKLYYGYNLVATFNRVYEKTYHKVIADLMNTPGLWFLKLQFNFENGNSYFVKSEDKKKQNTLFVIFDENIPIAEMITDMRVKNIKKLIENINLKIDKRVYEFRARSIRSDIEIYKDGGRVGLINRNSNGIRTLTFKEEAVSKEDKPILLIGWITFTYRFDK
ncbi:MULTISPECIES: hypothetical protein [Bacillaceae]|uniref:SMODS-associating 2TM beta-strand rich effector domain-containing protein n=1 Tax=Evansella alkalicola TaxID=745819 RepID=A0ABS6JP93_9BACI|nr:MULTISPECIES: hypothetical protein [Bacillaceae]MBU9720379.1 hypothetical protein [Bacillus alkalicola]